MKHGLGGLQNGEGGGLQLIMPENITNEMVLRSNGKCFGRLEEEEEEEKEEEQLPTWSVPDSPKGTKGMGLRPQASGGPASPRFAMVKY